jgi:replicative DNA helicase
MEVPHDERAERAVLAALLHRPSRILDIEGVVTPETFWQPLHREIFRAMTEIYTKRKTFDIILVSSWLKFRVEEGQDPDHIDDYVDELQMAVTSAERLEAHAGMIRNCQTLRELLPHIQQAHLGAQRGDEASTLIETLTTEMHQIQAGLSSGPVCVQDILKEVETSLDKGDTPLNRFKIGMPGIDFILGGLPMGTFTILAARTSVGKSSLCYHFLLHVSDIIPSAIFTLEVSGPQVVMNLASIHGKVDTSAGSRRAPTDVEAHWLKEAHARIKSASLFIDDTGGISISELRHRIRTLVRNEGVRFVVVDFLQLLQNHSVRRGASMYERVTDTARQLQTLSKELGIALVVISQLSRESERRADPKPRLSDLRDSGAIEEYADVVMLLHRCWREGADPTQAELIVGKHKTGPCGSVPLRFQKECLRFEDYMPTLVETP